MGHCQTITSAQQGARNLLVQCGKARPGERILILYEDPDFGYFNADLAPLVGDAARALGAQVQMIKVPFLPESPALSPDLRKAMDQADLTVFLARLGDQLRFSELSLGRVVVCFVLSGGILASGFGTGDYQTFVTLKERVNRALARARHVRVTCPAGTDFSGHPDMGDTGGTSVMRFPLSVFTPVPGEMFSGRVAMPGFLIGTGSRYYPDYMVRFEGPVSASFSAGRLTGFHGSAGDVARANRQYDRISQRYGLDRDRVHSWHAGLHPGCGFQWDAFAQPERWSGTAFGNPRILHLHTCGAEAPGEISWNVIDPTIEIDGVKLWENGVFYPDRLPGGADILRRAPMVAALFANPDRRIGLAPNCAVQTGETASKD
ncbi:hypothetical protein [Oceaniglobus ichthyenteri]|uniref:hypothetical protein n=1 Tax=Oceaniglobus ichthyenteri TaxID=2136177 RepID=UPI000D3D430B|nr:hypothetical protein [Oceaniglobus ichthyenteri]